MLEGFCLAAFFGSMPFFHMVTHCMFSICVLFLCCFPSLLFFFFVSLLVCLSTCPFLQCSRMQGLYIRLRNVTIVG
jgi:hypothetical protein